MIENRYNEVQEELKKAILGFPGMFVLAPEFAAYGVDETRLHTMTQEQNHSYCDRFLAFQFPEGEQFSQPFLELSVKSEDIHLPFVFQAEKVIMFNRQNSCSSRVTSLKTS